MEAAAAAAGHQERLRLVFATSDEAALTDIGQELAPAFFVSLATDSAALLQSLHEHAPEIVVIDLDTIFTAEPDVFNSVASVREAAADTLLVVISRRPLRNARQRTKKAGGDEFSWPPSTSANCASICWKPANAVTVSWNRALSATKSRAAAPSAD